GTRHRGVMAFSAEARGEGGHSSRADTLPRPIVELSRLALALDRWAHEKLTSGPPGFQGMCLNVADVRGGVAFNVVPPRAELVFSVRPPPDADLLAVKEEITRLAPPGLSLRTQLEHSPFRTRNLELFRPLLGSGI